MTLIIPAIACTAVGALCVGIAIGRANARQLITELSDWIAHERRYSAVLGRIAKQRSK